MKKLLIVAATAGALLATGSTFALDGKVLLMNKIRTSMGEMNKALHAVAKNQINENVVKSLDPDENFSTDAAQNAVRTMGNGYVTFGAVIASTGAYEVTLNGDDAAAQVKGLAITCQPFGPNNTAFEAHANNNSRSNAGMAISGYGCYVSSQPDEADANDDNTYGDSIEGIKVYSSDTNTHNMILDWNNKKISIPDFVALATST